MKEEKAPRTLYDKVDRVIYNGVKYISYVGAAALFVISVIATVNVIATKVFGKPIQNVTEFVTYLNVPVVFFCIGFVQLDRGHTHIDLIYRRFPKGFHKFIHILSYIIGVVVCGFAGWRGIVLTLQKFQTMTYASGPNSFLIWPFVACIGLGYLVLAVSFFWCIFKELHGESPYVIDFGGASAGKGE